MQGLFYRGRMLGFTAAMLLSACAVTPPQGAKPPVLQPAKTPGQSTANAESDPDTYTVQPGDTLIRIGLDSGQSAHDIARWNAITDPSKIVAGQVLRLTPPTPAAPSTTTPPSPAVKEGDVTWAWPAEGAVLAGFKQLKTKGLDIGGAAGDAVLAAADGKVIYAGADLRGYGNSVILKHNKTYVSLYAHNRTLLVKEDDVVKRGQKIAEMGNSETDRVKLHFEVRKLGTSVDPAAYLPAK